VPQRSGGNTISYVLLSILLTAIVTFGILQILGDSSKSHSYSEPFVSRIEVPDKANNAENHVIPKAATPTPEVIAEKLPGPVKQPEPVKQIEPVIVSAHPTTKPEIHATPKVVQARPIKGMPRPKTEKVKKALAKKVSAKTSAEDVVVTSNQSETDGVVEKRVHELSNPQLAQQTYAAALRLIRDKDYRKAEEYLNSALKFDARHKDARETLAGMLISQQRNDVAITLLSDGIQAMPDYFRFRELLAQLYLTIDNQDDALDLIEDTPRKYRDSAEYHSTLAAVQQSIGEYRKAIKSYTLAIEFQPNEGRWWLGIGLSHEFEEQYAEAEKAYTRAAEIGKFSPDVRKYIQDRLHTVRMFLTAAN